MAEQPQDRGRPLKKQAASRRAGATPRGSRSAARAHADEAARLETLLIELSSAFIDTPAKDIDAKIDWGLQRTVECLEIDRCSLWEFSADLRQARWTHQSTDPAFPPLPREFSAVQFPWTFETTRHGHPMRFARPDELGTEASIDRQSFGALGEKSVLVIPYSIGGVLVCGLSFAAIRHEREWPDHLIAKMQLVGEIIAGALHRARMEEKYEAALRQMRQLSDELQGETIQLGAASKIHRTLQEVIGESEAIKHVFFRVEQVAPTDAAVLVLGETGTGKGLIARAIHDLSPRRDRTAVTVNCAALPSNLIESELFGREKGAFTGAHAREIGRFELAHRGTLILDEVSELPLELQAKLLRVIQDGEFERLGSPRTIKVDVRLIALSNRDLKDEVRKRSFREDLYYRLNVFPITVPPLRERIEDVPLLVEHYVRHFAQKMRKTITTIPRQTLAALQGYAWPGNVRELEHVIERAVIVTRGTTLQLADKLEVQGIAAPGAAAFPTLAEVEQAHIRKALERTGWRIEGASGAAQLLGLHPNTLRGRMRKLGIARDRRPPSQS